MTAEKQPGLTGGYDKRDFEVGPSTYSDEDFLQKILDATELKDLAVARVGDFMCGPGKVGLALKEKVPRHQFLFLDLANSQLRKIPSDKDILKIKGDVRFIPCAEAVLDVVVARYSVKDLPKPEQPAALREIRRALKDRGVFVIADMVAPADKVKKWLNCQHALKQELGGRNPELEGKCHIPTEEEWLQMLQAAGFQANVFAYHTSKVDTQAWVRGKQITPEQLVSLNHMILTAPLEVRDQFKIRSEKHSQWLGNENLTLEEVRREGEALKVEMDYPVIIVKAAKMQE